MFADLYDSFIINGWLLVVMKHTVFMQIFMLAL